MTLLICDARKFGFFFSHGQSEAIRGLKTGKQQKQTCVFKRAFDSNKTYLLNYFWMKQSRERLEVWEIARKATQAFQVGRGSKLCEVHGDHNEVKILSRTEDLSPEFGDSLHWGENRSRPLKWFLAWGTVQIRRFTNVVGTRGWLKLRRKTLNSTKTNFESYLCTSEETVQQRRKQSNLDMQVKFKVRK